MKTVYVPWTMAAIRHARNVAPFAERVYQFNPQTRLLDVSKHFARFGATLHWNPDLRSLEAIPRYFR